MGDKIIDNISYILMGIIGLAIVGVLVSKSANTGNVLTSAGKAFATDIQAAVSPVSGGVNPISLNF